MNQEQSGRGPQFGSRTKIQLSLAPGVVREMAAFTIQQVAQGNESLARQIEQVYAGSAQSLAAVCASSIGPHIALDVHFAPRDEQAGIEGAIDFLEPEEVDYLQEIARGESPAFRVGLHMVSALTQLQLMVEELWRRSRSPIVPPLRDR